MACDAAEFRSAAEAMGATPVVPLRQNGRDNEYWPTCADEFWPTPGVFDLLSRA
jgi:hypothetical protein